jgi:hypothetical protein
VREFLIEAGVKPNSLTARGCGAARPVASNATESGGFVNRRVEFVPAQSYRGGSIFLPVVLRVIPLYSSATDFLRSFV